MVQFLIKLFVAVIITLSVNFKGVIRHRIVLCYLFIVLRLLCILKGIFRLVQFCLHLEVEVHRK